jgi:hypothetical protein
MSTALRERDSEHGDGLVDCILDSEQSPTGSGHIRTDHIPLPRKDICLGTRPYEVLGMTSSCGKYQKEVEGEGEDDSRYDIHSREDHRPTSCSDHENSNLAIIHGLHDLSVEGLPLICTLF